MPDTNRSSVHGSSPRDPWELLADAVRAARLAGDRNHRSFGSIQSHDVEQKHSEQGWNPVTEVDRESERVIVDYLHQCYPNHGFLGEENVAGRRSDSGEVWVIDPIDGTANYIHGIPHYGVAVGYARDGVVQVSACLDQERGELFTAVRGRGAWLNGAPIRSSATAELASAIVCTGFYYDRGEMMEATLDSIRRLFQANIHGLRRSGSAVLDICWTAAGRYDAFFEYELSPWDFGAASLVAEEAGATITDANGSRLTLESGHVICAAAGIHPALMEIVRRNSLAS